MAEAQSTPLNLGTFFVQRVIIHRIPKVRNADKAEHGLRLTQAESALDDGLRKHFRERITESLQTRRYRAAYEPNPPEGEESPVPQLIVDFFDSAEDNFVEVSQGMAEHLFTVQNGSASGGLLAVIEGVMGSGDTQGKCIAVLKLEMDDAILVEDVENAAGKLTVRIELQRVTMNEKAKVFKAALFPKATAVADLKGDVSDNQRDEAAYGPEVARFFVTSFLGCKLQATAAHDTKEFMERAETVIEEIAGEDGDKLARYKQALFTELNKPSAEIRPNDFVQEYFDAVDRDRAAAAFAAEDGPAAVVPKDTSLIAPVLRTTMIELEGDLRISGPRDMVFKRVKVNKDSVTIRAKVKRIGGRRGR